MSDAAPSPFDGLGGLGTIGLDDLVAVAALQTRVDRKYALRRPEALQILATLPSGTLVLESEVGHWSRYESVYFDTADFASYRLAATGRRRRFKLRTRSYLDTDTAFLEVKTKGSRDATVKDRIPYPIADRYVLTREGRDYAATAIEGIGIDDAHVAADRLAPVLTTEYERATLLQPGSLSRATIDTALVWQLNDGTRLERPDLVIVETKSGQRPSELDRLLWATGHRSDTISKFGTGLAALRPDLPSNKWTRVLRRHFHAAPAASPTH